MQVFPILVVAVVLAADGGLALSRREAGGGDWIAAAVAVLPVLLILLLAAAGLHRCERRLAGGNARGSIITADRIMHYGRWLILANHAAAVLLAGWLAAVRNVIGDPVLIDELIAIAPPVLGATGLWFLHYPLERRMREALLLRQLDAGRPIHPVPSRRRYVLQQARLHMLMLLVPVLMILGLAETMRMLLDRFGGDDLPAWIADAATLAAGVGVFLFSPLLARLVLSVEVLGAGPVRDDLRDICRAHRVKVRQALLWKTDGSLINAAVMGLIGPLRFVLLSDALIETMSREQVQAVMAHEIGHVRRHHMPWLVAALISMLLLAGFVFSLPLIALEWSGLARDGAVMEWGHAAATALAGAMALLAFGWISRRIERQADTFAVQHLSRGVLDEAGQEHRFVTPDAVAAMHDALGAIARLNSVDPHRKSWRHGSIAWRQEYLLSLVGRAVDAMPIDRFIRRAKIAVALILVLGIGGSVAIEWWAAAIVAEETGTSVTTDAPQPAATDVLLRATP